MLNDPIRHSDDEVEIERDYRRNQHKYEAEGDEEADNGDADEASGQEILDFDSDIAILKARWMNEKEEVIQTTGTSLTTQILVPAVAITQLYTTVHMCNALDVKTNSISRHKREISLCSTCSTLSSYNTEGRKN